MSVRWSLSGCSVVGADTAQCAYTCQLKAGSYQHEAMDAATYCAAGIDYVS